MHFCRWRLFAVVVISLKANSSLYWISIFKSIGNDCDIRRLNRIFFFGGNSPLVKVCRLQSLVYTLLNIICQQSKQHDFHTSIAAEVALSSVRSIHENKTTKNHKVHTGKINTLFLCLFCLKLETKSFCNYIWPFLLRGKNHMYTYNNPKATVYDLIQCNTEAINYLKINGIVSSPYPNGHSV